MKKYISVFVCITLLITAVIFIPNANNGIRIGRGNGDNEKLESPEDMQRLLLCIAQKGNTHMNSDNDYDVDVLSNYESGQNLEDISETSIETKTSETQSEFNTENKEYEFPPYVNKQEYKSVTIYESAFIGESSYLNYNGSSSSSDAKLNRQLYICMTEDASYYHSIGEIFSSSSYYSTEENRHKKSSSNANFDIEAYIEDGDVFLKFNSWSMITTEGTVIISDKIIGRWVIFDDLDVFEMVEEMNRSSLGTVADVINSAIDKDLFSRNQNKYTMSNNDVKEIFRADNLKQGEIVVDMSNPESPTMRMLIDASSEDSSSGVNSNYNSSRSSTYMDVNYVFKNINNTIVDMERSVDVLEIDEDEVEDYIFVNMRE